MDGDQKRAEMHDETPEVLIKRVFAVAKLLANAAEHGHAESQAAPEKPQKTQDRELDVFCI
jgi:hypothetical protein